MQRATVAFLFATVLVATSWAAAQDDAERSEQDSAGASPEFTLAGTPYARVQQEDPGPRTAHSSHAGGQVPLYRPLDVPADPDRYRRGTDEILIEAPERPDPEAMGIEDVRPLGSLTGFWVGTVADPFDAPRIADDVRSRDGVVDAYPALEVRAVPALIPDDPLYPDQWHHRNVAQHTGAQYKIDVRSHLAHDDVSGSGVHVNVVDDALQYTHPDLDTGRYDPGSSWDYCDDDPDPAPVTSDDGHGTAVTGLVAAEADNAVGVAGVAPGAAFSAIRLVCSGVTVSEFIEVVDSTWSEHDVSSNSWGCAGGAATTCAISSAERAAYIDGVANGRGGLGKIYVYAAGNSHGDGDDAGYEGHHNQRYMIAVGAVGNHGAPSVYSEGCACLLVTAPSNGGSFGLVTTDLVGSDGYSSTDYTCADGQLSCFSGTSGATPIVSGAVALMLEANPALTWQEVQWILAETANTDFLDDGHTLHNAAGVAWGHRVGFGVVDAHEAVASAATFPGLPPEESASFTNGTDTPIPDGLGTFPSPSPGPAVTYGLPIAQDFEVRTATLTMDITHTFENDLRILLESPSGTMTTILPGRPADAGADLVDFPVSAHAFRGERSAGTWKAHIMDIYEFDTGTVEELTLDVHGHAAVNDAPIALAPPPQNVADGDPVTLDASGSTDPDQDTLVFSWSQHKGPAVTLDDPSAPAPSFTAPSGPATLVFNVEVSDAAATDTALAVVHVT